MIGRRLWSSGPVSGQDLGIRVGEYAEDEWTIGSPKAPLPCHRCEYGGYRGTWPSVNESLLTYLWRNSVKDSPPIQTTAVDLETGEDWCWVTLRMTWVHLGGVGAFVCKWDSRRCFWERFWLVHNKDYIKFRDDKWASELKDVFSGHFKCHWFISPSFPSSSGNKRLKPHPLSLSHAVSHCVCVCARACLLRP